MEIKAFNCESKSLENVNLDIDVIKYASENRTKCVLYSPYSYYVVEDEVKHIIVKINNITRNIESVTQDNLTDCWYNISSVNDLLTCRIKNIIPNVRYRFNIRASISKFMFTFSEEGLGIVESNLPIINTLRSTVYENNRFPRKVLMWEFIREDEVAENLIFKVNFITGTVGNIEEDDIEVLKEMVELGESSDKFREHLRNISGYKSSEGKDKPTNGFDFVSTSDSEIPVRSEVYNESLLLIKNQILCNNEIAMGADTHKKVSSLIMGKFISRKVMAFKHSGIIPCLSIINYSNMFGFYPIWYLHPEIPIYDGRNTMYDLVDLLDLIDGEDVYDNEEEVIDVWKYFIPYYMADDWEEYAKMVAIEKSKLAGYSKPVSIDLIDEKDFIEFMLIHKFTSTPDQLKGRTENHEFYHELRFKPGVTPQEYKDVTEGYRCNFYIFRENGILKLRDCVNLETTKVSDLSNHKYSNFFTKVSDLLIKNDLIFDRVSPVLYICEKGDIIIRMSQIGILSFEEKISEGFLFDTPTLAVDDLFQNTQVRRFDSHTKTDEDYKKYYRQDKLPELVEKALYRSRGLDGFVDPPERIAKLFGGRRKPNFQEQTSEIMFKRWSDLRDIPNFYLGSGLMLWVTAGARGQVDTSAYLTEPVWDKILWFCPFNTWFASIEMAKEKFDWSGKENLKVTMNNRYNDEYYYHVNDFYSWGDVCMINSTVSGHSWRLVTDCIPRPFTDLSDLNRKYDIGYDVFNPKSGNGVFGIGFETEDILFRCKEYIIVEADDHRYLISSRNEHGVYVVENQIIDELDSSLLNSIEKVNTLSYVNGIWKLLHNCDLSRITKITENLYYVENPRLPYFRRYTREQFENPGTIMETFYVFKNTILYIFKCEDKVELVSRIDDSNLNVNGNLYSWNQDLKYFTLNTDLVEIDKEDTKMCNTVQMEREFLEKEEIDKEINSELEKTSLFEETKEDYEFTSTGDSKMDDFLYNFDENYFSSRQK